MSRLNAKALPSKKVFLYEIPQLAAGTKIRFLGCVTSYHIETATLTLAHYYPKELPKAAEIAVDIQMPLESVEAHEIEVGCWLNVIGYVRQPLRKRKRKQSRPETADSMATTIQAIMLWNAGALDIGNYESALEASRVALVGAQKMVGKQAV